VMGAASPAPCGTRTPSPSRTFRTRAHPSAFLPSFASRARPSSDGARTHALRPKRKLACGG
jgi:hypothetical protein